MTLLVVVIACACGRTSPSVPDATANPVADATLADASDEPTADARTLEHGTVTVIYLDNQRAPQVDRPVVFTNPDNTIAAVVRTDATGTARGDIFEGGSITAIAPVPIPGYELRTVLGVMPGDVIVLDDYVRHFPPAGSFTVTFQPYEGANSYTVYGPCSNTLVFDSPATIPVGAGCAPTMADLHVVAHTPASTTNPPDVFVAVSSVPFADGGSATMPANWQPVFGTTVTITTTQGAVFTPSRFFSDDHGTSGRNAGAGTYAFESPPSPLANLRFSYEDSPHDGAQFFRIGVPGAATSFDIDLGPMVLPWIEPVTFDPASATILMAPTDPAAADLLHVQAFYQRAIGTTPYFWGVFAPAGGNIAFPALPAEFADFVPHAGDRAWLNLALLIDASFLDGYEDARKSPVSLYRAYRTGTLLPAGEFIRSSYYKP